jgi:hypothetical protein
MIVDKFLAGLIGSALGLAVAVAISHAPDQADSNGLSERERRSQPFAQKSNGPMVAIGIQKQPCHSNISRCIGAIIIAGL